MLWRSFSFSYSPFSLSLPLFLSSSFHISIPSLSLFVLSFSPSELLFLFLSLTHSLSSSLSSRSPAFSLSSTRNVAGSYLFGGCYRSITWKNCVISPLEMSWEGLIQVLYAWYRRRLVVVTGTWILVGINLVCLCRRVCVRDRGYWKGGSDKTIYFYFSIFKLLKSIYFHMLASRSHFNIARTTFRKEMTF